MDVHAIRLFVLAMALAVGTPAAVAEDMVLAAPVDESAPEDAAGPDIVISPFAPEQPAATPAAGETASAVTAPPAPAPLAPPAEFPAGTGGGGVMMQLDYSGGSDTVVTVFFTDGSYDTISAGEGLGIAFGGHYRIPDTRWDFSAMVGYRIAQITDATSSVELTHRFIDIRADFFLNQDFWIGAGPVMHRDISYSGGPIGPGLEFFDADGMAYRVGYKGIALSKKNMEYVDVFGNVYDASSVALELIGRF